MKMKSAFMGMVVGISVTAILAVPFIFGYSPEWLITMAIPFMFPGWIFRWILGGYNLHSVEKNFIHGLPISFIINAVIGAAIGFIAGLIKQLVLKQPTRITKPHTQQ